MLAIEQRENNQSPPLTLGQCIEALDTFSKEVEGRGMARIVSRGLLACGFNGGDLIINVVETNRVRGFSNNQPSMSMREALGTDAAFRIQVTIGDQTERIYLVVHIGDDFEQALRTALQPFQKPKTNAIENGPRSIDNGSNTLYINEQNR